MLKISGGSSFRDKAVLKAENKRMSRKEYYLHFQLQANKPSLKVANSEGVVLCNCFIKCLWRKTDILGMSEDSSISAWTYAQLGAEGTPRLVNSLSAPRNVEL